MMHKIIQELRSRRKKNIITNKKWWTKEKLPYKEAKIHFTRLLRVNSLALSKNTVGYFWIKRDLTLFYTSPRKSYL